MSIPKPAPPKKQSPPPSNKKFRDERPKKRPQKSKAVKTKQENNPIMRPEHLTDRPFKNIKKMLEEAGK